MKLTQLNMVSWIFYIHLIMLSFIASIFVVNGWENYEQISFIGADARFYGWLSIQYTMIAMPAGMLFINYLYGYVSSKKMFNSYVNSSIVTLFSQRDSYALYPLYVSSFVSLVTVIYTFILLKNIPIYGVIQGLDSYSLALLRTEAFMEFDGSDTIRKLFGVTLTPILCYVAYAYWRLTKLKKHLIWFLIMFVFSFFIVTYNIAKIPVVLFILGFLFLNVLINGYVKKTTLFCMAFLALIVIVFAYIFVMHVVDIEPLFNIIWRRIIFGEIVGTFYSFEYFPNTHDFIGWTSLSKILPFDIGLGNSERAFKILMYITNPGSIQDGRGGVVNSLFIQEAWANFGLYGVIFAPFYVGMIVQLIYNFFLSFKKTPVTLGVLAYLSYKMPVSSGFYHFVFDEALVFIFIFFISIYVTALILKKIKKQEVREKIYESSFT